jgi:hypothetical protein
LPRPPQTWIPSSFESGAKPRFKAPITLVDTPWEDEQHFRDYLQAKLEKSESARKVQESLLNNGTAITEEVIRVVGLLVPIQRLAEAHGEGGFAQLSTVWKTDLDALKVNLATVEGLAGLKGRLTGGWLEIPKAFPESLKGLTEKLDAKPDQTATLDAQTFLTTAAEVAWTSAKAAYDTYCSVLEEELNTLYNDVQEDFSTFYRAINEDDESKFTAKLTPSEGKLDLHVNFYERGLFPPAAYHSEGHQDGMGVCLYLALTKRLAQHGISRERRNNLTRVLIAVERSTQESKANSSHGCITRERDDSAVSGA